MKLPRWFDASDAEAFGRELGEEFLHHFPLDRKLDEKDARRRLANAIEILGNRAAKFQREARLGWYRRARFMKAIREHLVERGLPEEPLESLVYELALRLARA